MLLVCALPTSDCVFLCGGMIEDTLRLLILTGINFSKFAMQKLLNIVPAKNCPHEYK